MCALYSDISYELFPTNPLPCSPLLSFKSLNPPTLVSFGRRLALMSTVMCVRGQHGYGCPCFMFLIQLLWNLIQTVTHVLLR